jgi:dolichyl-phosphate beta-glucosyltransferase
MWFSVVIPAYNEEKRIQETLFEADRYLSRQKYAYEIIVVDDGSTDKTFEIVENLKSRIKNLIILKNKNNQGKGSAVRQGMLAAKGAYRLFADADNSTPIIELEKLLPFAEKYDIIIGSRGMKGADIISSQPWPRKFLGNCYGLAVKIFAGLGGFYDTQCGFKIFSAKSADDIFSKCKINGWSFDVEALIMAKKLGYSVKEVPIIWSNRPGTKVRIKGMAEAIFDLFEIRRHAAGIENKA